VPRRHDELVGRPHVVRPAVGVLHTATRLGQDQRRRGVIPRQQPVIDDEVLAALNEIGVGDSAAAALRQGLEATGRAARHELAKGGRHEACIQAAAPWFGGRGVRYRKAGSVEKRAAARLRDEHLAARRQRDPAGAGCFANHPGDDGAESTVAAREVARAVERVHQPERPVAGDQPK
jgi:hypothetical protein